MNTGSSEPKCIQRKNVLENDHIFLVVALVGCIQSFVSLKSFLKSVSLGFIYHRVIIQLVSVQNFKTLRTCYYESVPMRWEKIENL